MMSCNGRDTACLERRENAAAVGDPSGASRLHDHRYVTRLMHLVEEGDIEEVCFLEYHRNVRHGVAGHAL